MTSHTAYTFPPNGATAVTGRDGYIISQALLYAIGNIQNLPEDRQEHSNMLDMCALARDIVPETLSSILWKTEYHCGYKIDLWPAGQDYSDLDYDAKEKLRAVVDGYQAVFDNNKLNFHAPNSDVVKFIE